MESKKLQNLTGGDRMTWMHNVTDQMHRSYYTLSIETSIYTLPCIPRVSMYICMYVRRQVGRYVPVSVESMYWKIKQMIRNTKLHRYILHKQMYPQLYFMPLVIDILQDLCAQLHINSMTLYEATPPLHKQYVPHGHSLNRTSHYMPPFTPMQDDASD